MMKIKLLCLATALLTSSVALGANDIPEKQLLQYKYVILFQLFKKDGGYRERKFYYIENKTEIQKTVNWLNKYYPDRHALDTHMLAIVPNSCIIFMNKFPESLSELLNHNDDEKLFWDIYLNFDIDGKIYFTKEQLTPLYKMFEDKGTPLKFDDTSKASDK